MANTLYDIPGLGGFLAAQDRRRAAGQQDMENNIQQMKLAEILNASQMEQQKYQEQRQRQQKLSEALNQSGGDLTKAYQLALQANMVDEAAKIHGMIPKPEKMPDIAQLINIRDAYAAKGDTRNATLLDAQIEKLNTIKEQTGQRPVAIDINGQPRFVSPEEAYGKKPWVRPQQGGIGGTLSATAQKELIQTDEEIQGNLAAKVGLKNALDINEKAMGFAGAGILSTAGTLLPEIIRPETIDITQNLDNIITNNVLPQLKSVFGAMPTEGERKVLLEVQGSVNKSPKVRKEIFERAQKAADIRLKFTKKKADALRKGTYFNEGIGAAPEDDGWSDL